MLEAAKDIGAYRSLEVEDACTAEALVRAIGSWGEFCRLTEGPALALARTSFLACYRNARRRLGPSLPSVRIAGLLEADGNVSRESFAWFGRLTAAGRVEQVREQAMLPAGAPVNQLTDGDDVTS